MKMIKSLFPLLLGFVGGWIAVWVVQFQKGGENEAVWQSQLDAPGEEAVAFQVQDAKSGFVTGSMDLRQAAQKTVPAVVNVTPMRMGKVFYGNPLDFWFGGGKGQIREEPIDVGIGSGVIITKDGFIITNNHVVDKSDKVMVTLNDKRRFEAQVVGTDPETDIALLKIDATDLLPVVFGNSDDVVLGEWVLAVGNPYNLTSTVTAGIISAKARGLSGKMSLESFLQTDAAVNPGNSGGALVNAKGELIGINTAIQSPTGSYSGYSFAVPVNVARKVVRDLREFGKVQRAILGIRMGELTPEIAQEMRLKERTGIYVGEVFQGGAADKAGLKAQDIILGINGHEVVTIPQLTEQLGQHAPGDTIQLTFSRNGHEKVIDVVLQNSNGEVSVRAETAILGAQVVPLTQEDQYRYRLKKGLKIQDLRNGKLKSAGLAVGYVIVKVNNVIVAGVDDFERAIKATKNDEVYVTAVSPRGRVEYFSFSLAN